MKEPLFSSPAELVKFLKEEYTCHPLETGDEIEVSREDSGYGAGGAVSAPVLEELCCGQYRIDCLLKDILPLLGEKTRKLFLDNVAFGSIVTKEFHATCVKSPDNRYAVLINKNFFVFLYKMAKVDLVLNNPERVVYCSEKKDGSVTCQDLQSYRDKMIKYYRQTGIPAGPVIGIDDFGQNLHTTVLLVWHLFILCHEISHILNGDLTKKIINFQKVPWLFAGDRNFRREYSADERAFWFLIKVIERKTAFNMDKRFILIAMARLFEYLSLISNDQVSSVHPPGVKRVDRLQEKYFSGLDVNTMFAVAENDFFRCLSMSMN